MRRESIYDRMTSAEKEVANVLKVMGIQWSFEQPVFVWDENKRPRVWAPDFYLTQFGIYLEVCGSSDFNYDYRKKIFEQNGYNVIFLHVFKTSSVWSKYLIMRLRYVMKDRKQTLESIIQNVILSPSC